MTEIPTDIRPIDCPAAHNGVQYFAYTCAKCGKEAQNTYSEPYRLPFHVCRKLCVSPTGIHYTEWHHARFCNLIQVRIVGWIYAS